MTLMKSHFTTARPLMDGAATWGFGKRLFLRIVTEVAPAVLGDMQGAAPRKHFSCFVNVHDSWSKTSALCLLADQLHVEGGVLLPISIVVEDAVASVRQWGVAVQGVPREILEFLWGERGLRFCALGAGDDHEDHDTDSQDVGEIALLHVFRCLLIS